MRVLVTGATGYIGNKAANALGCAGHIVTRGARRLAVDQNTGWTAHGDIAQDVNWPRLLPGIDCVVHCAGPAHVDGLDAALSEAAIVGGTARLAEAAADAGVRRLVLISSALVCGSSSPPGSALDERTEQPETVYAHMKLKAERRLARISQATGLERVVLRPPMVYGPGSLGNFARLVAAVRKGIPLPLGAARAPRSIIGIDNLVSAILVAAVHPRAAGRTYVVADGETTSTADLIRRIAAAMGRSARLAPVPCWLLHGVARMALRGADVERLLRPMLLDAGAIRNELGWVPPVALDDAVRRAVAGNTQ